MAKRDSAAISTSTNAEISKMQVHDGHGGSSSGNAASELISRPVNELDPVSWPVSGPGPVTDNTKASVAREDETTRGSKSSQARGSQQQKIVTSTDVLRRATMDADKRQMKATRRKHELGYLPFDPKYEEDEQQQSGVHSTAAAGVGNATPKFITPETKVFKSARTAQSHTIAQLALADGTASPGQTQQRTKSSSCTIY